MIGDKVIVEKTAWPVNPIENYSAPVGEWGYLIVYSDDTVEFIESEMPTSTEILKCWGYYFS